MTDQRIVKINKTDSLMSKWAEDALVEWIVGEDSKGTAKHLRDEVRRCAEEFAGPNPTRIESVLAETAALSLVALRAHEARFMSAETKGGISLNLAKFHLRKIEHAQRRLESSLKTLATIRRLATPVLQVNLAQNQQVNNQAIVGGADSSSMRALRRVE